MTKIVIVSDSHGNDEFLRYPIRQEQPFDLLIHAGDVEGNIDDILPPRFREYQVVCVKGNCDRFISYSYPSQELIPIKGDVWQRNIMVCHGDQYDVKNGKEQLLAAGRSQLADVIIYGHTHAPVCYETEDGILVINPGSVAFPHQPDRKHTYAVLLIDEDGYMSAAIKQIPDHIALRS